MQGKIIKGIAGFYYVYAEDGNTYECRAKGIFRKDKFKPLVGDNVDITVLDEKELEGSVTEIHKRKNSLIRPAVANVDQALVIFALSRPTPNLPLLDRFLIMMKQKEIPTIICFNKSDMVSEEEREHFRQIYQDCGSKLLFISAKKGEGTDAVRDCLRGHMTTVAGPSGVGKSTLINHLVPEAEMETGKISEKADRGKHTTRHSELFRLEKDSYILDTPGFTALEPEAMEKEELRFCFPEFDPYEGSCKFQGCIHDREPGCAVKEAVEDGKISKERYESYISFFRELKDRERRRYS